MHKEVCPAQISTSTQLSTGMQGFGGREGGTLPMAGQPGPCPALWHSFCQQGDSSFPSSRTYTYHGHPSTCSLAPKAQAGPEMEIKPGARAMSSTSSNGSSQGNSQPMSLDTSGRGGKGGTGAENGKRQLWARHRWKDCCPGGNHSGQHSSIEMPFGSHGHQEHSQVMLLWEQLLCLDLSSPKASPSSEVITQPYSISKN